MISKKRLAVLGLAGFAVVLGGCSLGGNKPAEQVIVEETPTPEPTKAATPTPTVAPDEQSTIFTSKNKLISIEVPDVTWVNKADQDDMFSFESPDNGKILILHASGDALNSTVLPDSEDMANSLEKASGYTEGTEYQLSGYNIDEQDEGTVIIYNVKYLDTKKSDGVARNLYRVYVNDDEYFGITASLYKEDEELLKAVEDSLNTLKIVGKSSLKNLIDKSEVASAAAPAKDTEGGQDSQGGEIQESMRGNYTDDMLSDTSQTRTIYRNSDGKALVVTPDDDGTWKDEAGNTYRFENDSDVYDQNDVDYYYHGEAGDVYFMPVDGGEESEESEE